jgi:outer membrane protein assembly factor BamB
MRRSVWSVWIAALVLPPVGLVLLWLRKGEGLVRKLFGTGLIAVWTVVYLMAFFGLHFELDGSGMPTIPTFRDSESHYAELERSRARQPAPPQAAVETVQAAAPADAPKPEAAKPAWSTYWTDFRGPRRDGVYEGPVLASWPASGLPLVWKQPIGGGYASFVIANGRAFTIEQRRAQEVATAYDLATGRELWAHGWNGDFREAMGGDGPRATPAWHEGRLYALGAEGELRCLDASTGKRIWSRNILSDAGANNIQWGMSAAPLIVDDKVIVQPGGPGASVVAYHKITGEPVWKALDDRQSYTSPMLVTLAGKRQILVVSAQRAMGLTPETGALLWDYPWVTDYDINSAQPIVHAGNRVFLSAGYGHGAAVIEIVPAGDKFQAKEIWKNNRMKNRFNSSVMFDGHIYGFDESIFGCIDAATGELKWKGGRYGYGQALLAGGNIVVTTESGEVALVKATPAGHEELARFPAVEGKTWNHPAISDGLLLVRNATEMACFRIAPK